MFVCLFRISSCLSVCLHICLSVCLFISLSPAPNLFVLNRSQTQPLMKIYEQSTTYRQSTHRSMTVHAPLSAALSAGADRPSAVASGERRVRVGSVFRAAAVADKKPCDEDVVLWSLRAATEFTGAGNWLT